MKRLIPLSALLVLLSCNRIEQPRFPTVGDTLPQFSVNTANGKTVNTKTLSSGNSLIVFFNTMCKDCREELPVIQQFYDDAGETVRIILISREEGKASVRKYWTEHLLTLPYSPQETRTVYNLFSNAGIPLCVLSKDGIIFKVYNKHLDKTMPTKEMLVNDFI